MNRAAALANRQVQIDVATFIQWVDARAKGRPALKSFYRDPLSEGVRAGVPRLARDEAVHEQRRAEDAVRRAAVSAPSGAASQPPRVEGGCGLRASPRMRTSAQTTTCSPSSSSPPRSSSPGSARSSRRRPPSSCSSASAERSSSEPRSGPDDADSADDLGLRLDVKLGHARLVCQPLRATAGSALPVGTTTRCDRSV